MRPSARNWRPGNSSTQTSSRAAHETRNSLNLLPWNSLLSSPRPFSGRRKTILLRLRITAALPPAIRSLTLTLSPPHNPSHRADVKLHDAKEPLAWGHRGARPPARQPVGEARARPVGDGGRRAAHGKRHAAGHRPRQTDPVAMAGGMLTEPRQHGAWLTKPSRICWAKRTRAKMALISCSGMQTISLLSSTFGSMVVKINRNTCKNWRERRLCERRVLCRTKKFNGFVPNRK